MAKQLVDERVEISCLYNTFIAIGNKKQTTAIQILIHCYIKPQISKSKLV